MLNRTPFAGLEIGSSHRRERADPAVLLDLIMRIKTASDAPALPTPTQTRLPPPLARTG